jgi:hypothetical protein
MLEHKLINKKTMCSMFVLHTVYIVQLHEGCEIFNLSKTFYLMDLREAVL